MEGLLFLLIIGGLFYWFWWRHPGETETIKTLVEQQGSYDEEMPEKYRRPYIIQYLENKSGGYVKYDEKKKMFVRKYVFFYSPVPEKEVEDAWNWLSNEIAREKRKKIIKDLLLVEYQDAVNYFYK